MVRRFTCSIACCFSLAAVNAQSEPLASHRFIADVNIEASDARVVWLYDSVHGPKHRSIGLSSPCLVDGHVYVGTDRGTVLGFRCDTGEPIFEHEHGERVFWAPVCDGTHVFVSSTKWVEAISCETGQSIWKKPIARSGGVALWPTRMPGPNKIQMLYVASGDGFFNGYLSWKGIRRFRGTLMTDVPADPEGFDGQRARMEDTVARPYGASTDGHRVYQAVFDQSRVIAFSAASGNVVWTFDTQGWVGATPVVEGNDLFIGSQDKRLYCVDSRTGEKKWDFQTGSRVSAAPAVHANRVFASSCDGNMYCLDRATGQEIWRFSDPDEPRSVIYTDPVLSDTTIYFAVGKGLIYAINVEDGRLHWKLRPLPKSQLYADLVTDGKRLFTTSRPADRNTGKAALVAVGPAE